LIWATITLITVLHIYACIDRCFFRANY